MVFYLKVNRDNSYVIPNLRHWIDATKWCGKSIVYILCDNDALKKRIIEEIDLDYTTVEFLKSVRDSNDINLILKGVCGVDKWIRIGQAHLTTHFHAVECKYEFFWNIDADDTFICLDPLRIAKMFHEVERYSLEHGIRMNSLDMWRSMSAYEEWEQGLNWSLGITFVDNRIDWIDILKSHCMELRESNKVYKGNRNANLDWYFTYLKNIKAAEIGTYYVENMKFLHFMDYFFNYSHLSSFMQWKEGKLKFPIWKECLGTRYRTEIPIADDIIGIDMDVSDDEALISLVSTSKEVFAFYKDIRDPRIRLGAVMETRCSKYMEDIKCDEMVCWGTGNVFFKYYPLVCQAYKLKYVCDNDFSKWGQEIVDGVKCISPDELRRMENVFVLVMIDNIAINYNIIHQLLEMGITKFDHFDNWIETVEGVR